MPKPVEIGELLAGEVGFFAATIKNVGDTKIATPSPRRAPAAAQLPGFEDIKPMVFAGLYTVDSHEHTLLRDALEKLRSTTRRSSLNRKVPSRSLWIPLRLSRPASYGNHPGAARARV